MLTWVLKRFMWVFWGQRNILDSTNGKLVVWGPVVWDSNRGTPNNPFHVRGSQISNPTSNQQFNHWTHIMRKSSRITSRNFQLKIRKCCSNHHVDVCCKTGTSWPWRGRFWNNISLFCFATHIKKNAQIETGVHLLQCCRVEIAKHLGNETPIRWVCRGFLHISFSKTLSPLLKTICVSHRNCSKQLLHPVNLPIPFCPSCSNSKFCFVWCFFLSICPAPTRRTRGVGYFPYKTSKFVIRMTIILDLLALAAWWFVIESKAPDWKGNWTAQIPKRSRQLTSNWLTNLNLHGGYLYSTWKVYRWRNSHVLVYHCPLLYHLLEVALYFHHSVTTYSWIVPGQISIIPKPELRGFWRDSPTKPPFGVTSAEVVIICPEQFTVELYWVNRVDVVDRCVVFQIRLKPVTQWHFQLPAFSCAMLVSGRVPFGVRNKKTCFKPAPWFMMMS